LTEEIDEMKLGNPRGIWVKCFVIPTKTAVFNCSTVQLS